MTNTIKSKEDANIIVGNQEEVWIIKSHKKLLKFWKWMQKKKIMPGDKIPIRVLKRYYKRADK